MLTSQGVNICCVTATSRSLCESPTGEMGPFPGLGWAGWCGHELDIPRSRISQNLGLGRQGPYLSRDLSGLMGAWHRPIYQDPGRKSGYG